ncbi:MAG: carbohydrate binding family 9 domain-containing protein, partial [Candidatus Aminicenantes bacterium]|nr:carbohydrate binding family 9 domain-containing protein [Candidatus Aminicenantes bacterium]
MRKNIQLGQRRAWQLALLLGFVFTAAEAAEPKRAAEPVVIYKADTQPVIDGKLDEPLWQQATRFDNFITFKPDYGKPTSEKTTILMTYDRKYIYFAFDCQDSEPSMIKAAMAKRDGIDMDDWIGVVLDTFGDKQGGYLFEVNPLGVQMDGKINSDGNGDASYDTVWESKGQIHKSGYSAEKAIP